MPHTPPTTTATTAEGCARCPAASTLAHRLVAEAGRWAAYAAALAGSRKFCPYRKALDAVAFSLRAGLGALAVPTKLVGVAACQGAVRALRRSGAPFGFRLHLEKRSGRLDILCGSDRLVGDRLLGNLQEKHEPWVSPLVGCGVEIRLIGVTGREEAGHTLGVNVAVCVPPALPVSRSSIPELTTR